MGLGGKGPGRQTVIIIAALFALIWFLTAFRGTDPLTSSPVSKRHAPGGVITPKITYVLTLSDLTFV